jgi:hypothetical protein
MLVYRVSQGRHTRWFIDSGQAKQYADVRFEEFEDGVPFCDTLHHSEMMVRLNELESRRAGEDNFAP